MKLESAMVRVKICGITSKRDAFAAVDAGADALGFVLYPPSPRSVTPNVARSIVRLLPAFVVPVAVVVDRPAESIEKLAVACGFRLVQLHGAEPPGMVRRLEVPVMKAIRVRDGGDIRRGRRYRPSLFLLDSYDPIRPGGTGRRLPLVILRRARLPAPFFLAGGLTPRNVRSAVRAVRPFGVDASSGVERSPGRKDHTLVRRFVRAAKAA